MRQTFGSVTDLASFASKAVKHLGVEKGNVDEEVNVAEPYRVYTRSASFDKSPSANADRVESGQGWCGDRAGGETRGGGRREAIERRTPAQ